MMILAVEVEGQPIEFFALKGAALLRARCISDETTEDRYVPVRAVHLGGTITRARLCEILNDPEAFAKMVAAAPVERSFRGKLKPQKGEQ